MFLNEFVNKTVSDMLNEGYLDESFRRIVATAIGRAIEECAQRVAHFSDLRIPASEYANLLRSK
jgi:hypothetical protein